MMRTTTMSNPTSAFSDQAILDAWHANADPWTDAVRHKKIASRKLVTDAAIIDAIVGCRPRSLLDIGCGEGWLVRELSRRGIDCLGVDAVPALVDAARIAGGNFQALSYADIAAGAISKRFDIAACNFSLIGDAATEALIATAPRLLNPGGALIIQTLHPVSGCGDAPYVDGWREGSWVGIEGDFAAPAPWFFRTLQGWVDLIRRSGLVIERLVEPLHPNTGKPASIIFACAVNGAAA
jgi:2-polyprenyl-3-methyl-5-hydroxy-6-metoxy-1,4-benzoquinol methylase